MKKERGFEEKVAGIILAAGSSSRMGQAKQLLPLHGIPLVACVVKEALNSRLDHVFLVLGHMAESVREALGDLISNPRLSALFNPDYQEGMSSSIRTGIRQAGDDFAHAMIILGDMPFISGRIIDDLIVNYIASARPLGALLVGGLRSHPVILSRVFYPDLLKLGGDKGARDLFALHEKVTFLFEPAAPFDPGDIDTPSDYECAQRKNLSPRS